MKRCGSLKIFLSCYIVMLLHYGSSPLTLNPFQYILEFGTTHRVALCVVHLRFTKSNQTYNKSQD